MALQVFFTGLAYFLRTATASSCSCGYSVNSTNSSSFAVFTSVLETDFLHLISLPTTDPNWQTQAYNVSSAAARGPYGKIAEVGNVIMNPIPDRNLWEGEGVHREDPGLQLWVRAGQSDGGMIGMGEITSARRDMQFGSFRVGMKMSNVSGTCGAFFWFDDNTQEIDIEFLSKEFDGNNNSLNLVVQTPQSAQAGYDAAGTPDFKVIQLPFAPDDGYHDYRFDWVPNRVSFYADGVWLEDMTDDIPSSPGGLFLNHWSNGDPKWSAGPPQTDAVLTVSYVKAYFNTSGSQNTGPCTKDPICEIPDQKVAPNPVAPNGGPNGSPNGGSPDGNQTGNTTFFTPQQSGSSRRISTGGQLGNLVLPLLTDIRKDQKVSG
ncbi:MAG: hypothetical protein M1820_001058 [Bogoriella megaspora]|nr:MAG: hypothetical protein M1820_001058 [Bogoriella megaspora]